MSERLCTILTTQAKRHTHISLLMSHTCHLSFHLFGERVRRCHLTDTQSVVNNSNSPETLVLKTLTNQPSIIIGWYLTPLGWSNSEPDVSKYMINLSTTKECIVWHKSLYICLIWPYIYRNFTKISLYFCLYDAGDLRPLHSTVCDYENIVTYTHTFSVYDKIFYTMNVY